MVWRRVGFASSAGSGLDRWPFNLTSHIIGSSKAFIEVGGKNDGNLNN